MKKPQYMRNTRTGRVLVYHAGVIEEMPWYEPVVEEEAQPEQPQDETAAAEKPKRKNWKTALAEKAQELEGNQDEETSLGEAQPEKTEQTSDVGSEVKSESNG